jgi:hypothetical protein
VPQIGRPLLDSATRLPAATRSSLGPASGQPAHTRVRASSPSITRIFAGGSPTQSWQGFEDWLKRIIQRRLDKAARPGFLHPLRLQRFDLGFSSPQIKSVSAVCGATCLTPGQLHSSFFCGPSQSLPVPRPCLPAILCHSLCAVSSLLRLGRATRLCSFYCSRRHVLLSPPTPCPPQGPCNVAGAGSSTWPQLAVHVRHTHTLIHTHAWLCLRPSLAVAGWGGPQSCCGATTRMCTEIQAGTRVGALVVAKVAWPACVSLGSPLCVRLYGRWCGFRCCLIDERTLKTPLLTSAGLPFF